MRSSVSKCSTAQTGWMKKHEKLLASLKDACKEGADDELDRDRVLAPLGLKGVFGQRAQSVVRLLQQA